jgi:hypothetical protein
MTKLEEMAKAAAESKGYGWDESGPDGLVAIQPYWISIMRTALNVLRSSDKEMVRRVANNTAQIPDLVDLSFTHMIDAVLEEKPS